MKTKELISRHLQVLCNEIGARPTGSQNNQKAVLYACKEFEKYGLNIKKQEFACMDWKNYGGSIQANGSLYPVLPSPYSLPCDVHGKILSVETIEELRKKKLAGRIVLLHGKLTDEPLMPKSFVFWNPEEHKEIISLLETGAPLAVLTVSPSEEADTAIIEDGDFTLPCAVISRKISKFFTDGTNVHLTINTIRKPAKSANVIADLGSGERKICFSAHIDTSANTFGVLDNASGVALLLSLASKLSAHTCPCHIEFVLFNGEDYYSNPGEMAYLNTFLCSPSDYLFAVNIDGAGLKESDTVYSFYECPPSLEQTVTSLSAQYEGYHKVAPWPQGDHTLFSISGVPAISVTSDQIFTLTEQVLHTKKDRIELIDTEKLKDLAKFLYELILNYKELL